MTHPRKRDKVRQLFSLRPRTPQSPNVSVDIPAISSTSISTPLSLQPQSNVEKLSVHGNSFVKGENFQSDMAVLSIAFVLQENPELKKLIQLIVKIDSADSEDQFIAVLEKCARLGVQLASVSDAHQAEAGQSITALIKIVEQLQNVRSDGDQKSVDELLCTINKGLDGIKPSFIGDGGGGAGPGETLSKVLDVTIGPTLDILNLVKSAGGLIPVPYVQPLIGTVVNILQAVSQTRANYKEMRQIAATAGNFVVSCAVVCAESSLGPTLEKSLKKFNNTLRSIAEECEKLRQISLISRYLQQSGHVGKLQEIAKRLDNAIKLFQTENSINLKLDTEELNRKMDFASLNNLPSHPRYTRNEYLEKSRDDVLEYLSEWITNAPEPVLWVHGAAGLGKSTVAQELVYLLKSEDRLAGGVFLTNLTMEAPETVVQMIARQLGEMYPLAVPNIAEAARKLQGPHNSLENYFKEYLYDPIRDLQYPYLLVVVIDGLDEWRNRESFLAELVHIPSPSPLKFVLTSRFSYSIERIVTKMLSHTYSLPLVSQQLIEHYFRHHFSSGNINWKGRKPDNLSISQLAAQAGGLLIWAATARLLITNTFSSQEPHQILDQILSSGGKMVGQKDEHDEARLDRLYCSTISTLFPQNIRGELRKFLAATLVLQEALPIPDFARLSGMSECTLEEIHKRLAALQTQGDPKTSLVYPAMQRFHASFVEFITTDSSNQPFNAISSTEAHIVLGKKCLEIVFVEFLPSFRGKTCIYSQLHGVELYAVKFWPLHFSSGSQSRLIEPSADEQNLDFISEEGMQHWAALFLPSIDSRFRHHVDNSFDGIRRSILPYEIAKRVGNEAISTLSYHIHCLEMAAQLEPLDLEIWEALGKAYTELYKQSQLVTDLEKAITVYRHGLGQSTDPPERFIMVMHLAISLQACYSSMGALRTLDEAISLYREALHLQPATHPDHSTSLNNLALCLQNRFGKQGTIDDLNEAILLHRQALLLRPAPHPDRSKSLNNLANSLWTRFGVNEGVLNDLDESISLHREALDLQPASHPDDSRFMSFTNLANSLQTRFMQQGSILDLDEAISLHRKALQLLTVPHPERSMVLNNLGFCLQTHFDQQGSLNNLNEAISLHREALYLRHAPHPYRSMSLNNLANSLQTRFGKEGALNDLDEAISLHKEALCLQPAPHPNYSVSLSNLAVCLRTRFRQQNNPSDLDESISLLREALYLRPESHPDRPSSLNNLANALQSRFDPQTAPNDLDDAISLHREALQLWPEFHPNRSASLNNLALCLEARFDWKDTPADLDEAISLYREALQLRPSPHPDNVTSLYRLAYSLHARFEQQHLLNDITEAISFYRQLLNSPIEEPYHAFAQKLLPKALQDHDSLINGEDDYLSEAEESDEGTDSDSDGEELESDDS